MAKDVTRQENENLAKVAGQIGACSLLPVAKDGHIILRITANFAVKSFVTKDFYVSIGLTQATLRLTHPGFDASQAYQAHIDSDFWAESWAEKKAVHGELSGELGVKTKIAPWLTLGFKAGGGRKQSNEESIKGKRQYQIVKPVPGGWEIGSELGEPRTASGAVKSGMENCLQGGYMSGRNNESGEGLREDGARGEFVACRLDPREDADDPTISLELVGSAGALKIVIDRKNLDSSVGHFLKSTEDDDKLAKLKQAFIKICYDKAIRDKSGGDNLAGEFFLGRVIRSAPKLARTAGAGRARPPRDAGAVDQANLTRRS